ncbi:LPXTG cell wall anchor domain-containing protein [Nocardioides sp. W3-2-3]|uniref:LPXTG cell wall anchor domain-containing protein n=1 Tax=Nocardioides convexus TaxID=2712224 RepID=UPI002418250E|nr:LPXTG cell wall anchor domain-containing protein [Nocardioides convexus]NHA02132.1 LPXTG cell wall anchor domain-containing protein [Nocardioides convexus]
MGQPSQTTLVDKSAPEVRTQINDAKPALGAQLQDTAWVSGLEPGVTVQVEWTLHGPVAPKDGKCQNLDWSKAAAFDTGVFTATANGKYVTRLSKKLDAEGCYTYSESIAETPKSYPYDHAPGHVTQTALTKTPTTPKAPASPKGPSLPNTGGPALGAAGGGLALLAAGGVMLARSRRRTTAAEVSDQAAA